MEIEVRKEESKWSVYVDGEREVYGESFAIADLFAYRLRNHNTLWGRPVLDQALGAQTSVWPQSDECAEVEL